MKQNVTVYQNFRSQVRKWPELSDDFGKAAALQSIMMDIEYSLEYFIKKNAK
jgi:hypothetical protein